jgi:hypothetical protein
MTTPPPLTVIDEIAAGRGLDLTAAARLLPGRAGKPASSATVWRWARDGVWTPDGRQVRLEVARWGGRCYTSQLAILRFLQALNAAPAVAVKVSVPA